MSLTSFQRAGLASTAFNFNSNQNGYSRTNFAAGGRNPASVIEQRQNASNGTRTMQFPSDLPPIHFNMIQADFATSGDQARAKLTSNTTISFPVPLSMTDPHRVIYNDGYSYLGALKDVGGTIFGNGIASNLATAGGTALGAAIKATGFSINSFRGVTIEQPQFKNHQFSWKFSPKSKEESITLQKILYRLKQASSLQFSDTFGRFVFAFPSVFIPYFSNAPVMYKFKPCVITAIDADYVGGNEGPSFFRETDAPESIVVQISLLELEYWVKEDYDKDMVDGLPSEDPFGAWNWYGIDGIKSVPETTPIINAAITKAENIIKDRLK